MRGSKAIGASRVPGRANRAVNERPSSTFASIGDPRVEARVVDALRAWRLAEARHRGMAPFVILHDRTLEAIAARLPDSPEVLGTVHGIGPAKLATYGEAILTLVSAIVAEHSDPSSETPAP